MKTKYLTLDIPTNIDNKEKGVITKKSECSVIMVCVSVIFIGFYFLVKYLENNI